MFNKKEYEHQRYLKFKEEIKRTSKKYYHTHKDVRKEWELNTQEERKEYRKTNKQKINETRNKYRSEHPWVNTFVYIVQRCTNPNNDRYEQYKYRRGDITVEQLRELWFECKAYLMEQPEIDRINNDGVYTKSNLQYLEKVDHIIKTAQERKLKKLGVKI
jgi:multidrug efflux pump subunit AcrB